MSLSGYEDLIECPYNKAHQILKYRFQTHLVKCSKNYPDVKKVKCPFNAVHLINEPELAYHVAACPNRDSLDRYMYNIHKGTVNEMQHPDQSEFVPIESENSWDNENSASYDPQDYVESAPVLRTLNLEKPSMRIAFRESERRRIEGITQKKE